MVVQETTSHEGPLTPNHPNWKGYRYNVMIEWGDGEISLETLHVISADSPVECAIYMKDNNFLNTQGWKCFKLVVKQKNLFHATNQAKT